LPARRQPSPRARSRDVGPQIHGGWNQAPKSRKRFVNDRLEDRSFEYRTPARARKSVFFAHVLGAIAEESTSSESKRTAASSAHRQLPTPSPTEWAARHCCFVRNAACQGADGLQALPMPQTDLELALAASAAALSLFLPAAVVDSDQFISQLSDHCRVRSVHENVSGVSGLYVSRGDAARDFLELHDRPRIQ